ncbi:MAG TPA: methyltransferase domain-containing protein [Nitrolancea sp.]|nr:methyltransferase domain-containing protein [Nitrolancea sp.]
MNADRPNLRDQFDRIYGRAHGDARAVPWAKQAPHPLLTDWLCSRTVAGEGKPAIVIGCGLGDDAEALANVGFAVTAIDISQEAIDWCKRRFPASFVTYLVQDLFATPAAWQQAFELVLESCTLQAIPAEIRPEAMVQVAALVAPGATALIICRGGEPGEIDDRPPHPLTRAELQRFQQVGLAEVAFDDVPGRKGVRARHFRLELQRPTKSQCG